MHEGVEEVFELTDLKPDRSLGRLERRLLVSLRAMSMMREVCVDRPLVATEELR